MKLALSVDDVKEMTGIGKNLIYSAIKTGKLKAGKLNTRTIILRKDLDEFLDDLVMYPKQKEYNGVKSKED